MTAPYGSRRIEITTMARQRMTSEEKATVERTCRDRGFLLSLMFSARERAYVAKLTAGGHTYEGIANQPFEAWRRALGERDAPRIVSLLGGDAA